MDPLHEPRDRARERALLALACALILAASTRVTLPLVIFAAVVGLLALPMSSLIAWLSRFDPRPSEGDDDDGTFTEEDELEPHAGGDDPAWGEVVPFVRIPAEPLPRPIRPEPAPDERLRA
jgi:hypothetical protein